MLYHVTSKFRAINSLVDSGLDWRHSERFRYGCGVSFSDNIEYADYHANKSTVESIIIYQLTKNLLCPPPHSSQLPRLNISEPYHIKNLII